MRNAWTLSTLVLCASVALAQESAPQERERDPFDVSAAAKMTKELGVPTTSEVQALEQEAKRLYDSGNCKAAEVALDKFARKANWLANLITGGLQPYYDAPYDERRGFSGVNALVPFESLANDYRTKRNRAIVMRAECLLKLGQTSDGVMLLINALDLIDIDDHEWWSRARMQLYSVLEVR